MAKNLTDYGSEPGSKAVNDKRDEWAKLKDFRDPVTGRPINSIGDTRPQRDVNPSPVGTGLNKDSDSTR